MTASGGDLAALRLDLINQGVRLGDDLLAAGFAMALSTDVSGSGGEADGIDLVLPGGWWTNVSIAPGYARTSPYTLALDGPADPGRLALRHRGGAITPVTIPDTARFRHARTHAGTSCGDIGAVHGSWVVVAPFAPRADLQLDRPRRFLGMPPQRPLQKSQWSVDEVVACVEAAWRLAGARLVHLEASHLLRDDGGLADLAPYVAALKRAVPTLVSISTLPPTDPAQVLELYAAGCDAMSYHLLAWDEGEAARVAPVRHRFIPRQRLMGALAAAARYFPRGAVSTDLLLGLEPLANVSAALRELTALGVVPNLAVFRPLAGAGDEVPHGDLVGTEPILRLMDERRALLQRHGLWHSRVRGFPRTLSGFDRYHPGLVERLYASTRRFLRVQREAAA